jgi:hypothetical protein
MHEAVKHVILPGLERRDAERSNDDMPPLARVPAAVVALVFAGSLEYFELLDDGRGARW